MCNIPVPAASQLPDTLSVKAGTSHDTDERSAEIVSPGGACSSERQDEDDIACVPAECDRPIHFYDYHIVYLPSYSVPTLLFNGRHKGMLRLNASCAQLLYIATYAILSQCSPPKSLLSPVLNASKASICAPLAFCRFFACSCCH